MEDLLIYKDAAEMLETINLLRERLRKSESDLNAVRRAALNLADANTRNSHAVLAMAKKLNAESDPSHVESERQANSILTQENERLCHAVEHGQYLANAAESFIAAIVETDKASIAMQECVSGEECEKADHEFINASESMNDHLRSLKRCIYEFRKRANQK